MNSITVRVQITVHPCMAPHSPSQLYITGLGSATRMMSLVYALTLHGECALTTDTEQVLLTKLSPVW